ncbi:hypothetical protein CsSME_00016223 [Camellia sinensis var. sinensis]
MPSLPAGIFQHLQRNQRPNKAMDAHSSGSDDFSVGCILSIKTTLGDEFEAQVITFDPPSNILVLQEGKSGSGQLRNIRLLKANYIESFKYLGQAEDPLDPKKFNLDLNSTQSLTLFEEGKPILLLFI